MQPRVVEGAVINKDGRERVKPAKRQAANGDLYSITKEKRLLRKIKKVHSNTNSGWEVLLENVAISDKTFEVGISTEGSPLLLTADKQQKAVYLYDVERKKYDHFMFKISNYPFYFYYNAFYQFSRNSMWKISLENGVEESDYDVQTIKTNSGYADLVRNPSVYYTEIYKNINEVSILSDGRLCFGKQILTIRNNSQLYFEIGNGKKEVVADVVDRNTFQFKDGSKVVNKFGVIQLLSRNDKIPPIYIVSVLDRPTAFATEKHFAGNLFYYQQSFFQLRLLSVKKSFILEAIKQLKSATNFGIDNLRLAVKNAPSILPGYFTQSEKEKIVADMKKEGIVLEPLERGNSTQEKIEVLDFQKRYIEPFISTILDYEA